MHINKNKKIISFVMMMFFVFSPFVSFGFERYETGSGIAPKCNTVLVPATDSEPAHYEDACDFNVLVDTVNKTIDFALFVLATPLFAIILIYAGITYITAGGNVGNTKKATKMITNALVGYLLALAAWIIIKTIVDSLGFNGPTFLSLINNFFV